MLTAKLLSQQTLIPGGFYTFLYTSSKSKEKEGALVKITLKDFAGTIGRLAIEAEARLAKQQAEAVTLAPLWTSINASKSLIEKITAHKKETGIRLWDKYGEAHPESYAHYLKANADLESTKTVLTEKTAKEDTGETKVDAISFFFRQYDPTKIPDTDNCYVAEAGYIGKSIDMRNGNVRHLFLAKETWVTEEEFKTIRAVKKNVTILEEMDTDA